MSEQEAEARARLADQNPVAALLEEKHRLVAVLAKAEQELSDLRDQLGAAVRNGHREKARADKAEQEKGLLILRLQAFEARERELGLKYDQLKSEFLSYKELTEIEIDGYREQIQKLQDK